MNQSDNLIGVVLPNEEELFLNKKENIRFRLLGFYFTELKSIALTCTKLHEINNGISVSTQMSNSMKNLNLLNEDGTISSNGRKLLKILYYNNFEVLNEIFEAKSKVLNISEKTITKLEFFLYLSVNRLDKGGGFKGQPKDVIINIEYFLNQVQDLYNNLPSNNQKDMELSIKKYLNLGDDNLEMLYLFQSINFTGSEIVSFLKLSENDKHIFINNLNSKFESLRLLTKEEKAGLSGLDSGLLQFADNSIQKDIRYRVKYAIRSHILFKGVDVKNGKIIYNEYDENNIQKFIVRNPREWFKNNELDEVFYWSQFGKGKYAEEYIRQYTTTLLSVDDDRIKYLRSSTEEALNVGDLVMFENENSWLHDYVIRVIEIDQHDDSIIFENCYKINRKVK